MRAILLALLAGCTSTWSVRDEDGDGVSLAQGDCNDKPGVGAQQSPLAEEVWYDGIDQNCDGADDYDQDGDGARSAAHGGDDCWDDPTSIPADMTALNGLPQLDAADVHPGAADAWYDGIDQDCDASNDFDQDGDGFDSAWYTSRLGDGNDCYDAVDDPFENGSGAAPEDVNPAATDSWYDGTDQDCGGEDDYDQDGDGFPISEECDDEDPAVYPNPDIEEVWYNGFDENCDGNDADQDGDGFLVEGYVEADPPIHFGYAEGDCWDDPSSVPVGYDPINGFPALDSDEVFPTAVETWYDGIDQDCGGDDDFDQDADGFESDAWPDRAGAVGEDCDDEEGTTYPGAVETWYDGVDADCDTWSDFDQDRDGFDSDDYGGEDCDDGRALTNPGVNEECGTAQDDDCSGATDDRDANDCETFFYDGDGDTYGTTSSQCWCNPQTATNYDAENDDDCNDSQAGANPGVAREDCSTTFDDDCDGALEEQNATNCSTFYLDSDGDGYGSTSSQCWCEAQTGTNYDATVGTDCDDTRSSVNPGATEICDSSNRDEDCDGTADNNDSSASSTGKTRYYPDDDGDEYGDSSDAGTLYCDDPSTSSVEWATTATDCNDANAAINPGATEICDATDTDEDCDGTADDSDSSTSSSTKVNYYTDADADGYGTGTASLRCNQPSGTATNATDCDDTRSSVNPGATEVCDSFNRDEDCDGTADDSDSSTSSSSKSNYYVDADLDTYGAGTAVLRCDSASGYSTNATDCDDTRSSVNPGATEVCDSSNRDEDCDGTADNNDSSASSSGKTRYYPDDDGDEYGDSSDAGTLYCDDPSTSSVEWATTATDCNDASAAVNPGASEVCDSSNTDEDCDGSADDSDTSTASSGKTNYYVDADGDSYGTGTATARCDALSGYVTNATDCDDTRSSVNPGATEVCDSSNRDEDCDGNADDNDTSTASSGKTNYYRDADSDTYGAGTATARCDQPSGYVTNATDCDDTRSSVNPGATEVCDSSNRDEDCDGTADDSDTSTSSSSKTSYYVDADSDAYGTGTALLRCEAPSGYATVDGDCDDADATVNPGETDPTDGTLLDEDCDGIADDDGLVAGDLVFTEFFVAGSVASNDWVEVYNASGVDLDLEGWELTLCYVSDSSLSLPVDGADCDATDVITVSGSLVVPDGGYAVFCNSASLFTPAACDYDYNYTNITSSGGIASSIGGFAVEVPAAAIDSFYWWNTSGSNDWPTGSNSKSIQLDAGVESSASAATTNDDYSTNDSDDDIWCQYPGSNSYSSTGLLGTPATANDACP